MQSDKKRVTEQAKFPYLPLGKALEEKKRKKKKKQLKINEIKK